MRKKLFVRIAVGGTVFLLAGFVAIEAGISYVGSIRGYDINADDIRIGGIHSASDTENFRGSCDYFYDQRKEQSCRCLADRSKTDLSWFDISMMAAEYTGRNMDILRLWKGYADNFIIGQADTLEFDRFKAGVSARQSAVKSMCNL